MRHLDRNYSPGNTLTLYNVKNCTNLNQKPNKQHVTLLLGYHLVTNQPTTFDDITRHVTFIPWSCC